MIRAILTFVVIFAAAYLILAHARPAVDALAQTDVHALLSDAHKYDGRRVTVSGRVVKSAALLGVGGFILDQEGTQILVISHNGTPEFNAHVTVSGIFKQAIAINDLQYAVILEND